MAMLLETVAEAGVASRQQPLAFPAARRVLWDRTTRGEARQLCIDAWEPAVTLVPDVAKQLAQRLLAGRSSGNESFVAKCRNDAGGQSRGRLDVVVERLLTAEEAASDEAELALDADECLVHCFLRYTDDNRAPASGDARPTASEISSAMNARDSRLKRGGPLRLGDSLAWAALVAVDGRARRIQFRFWTAFPRSTFSFALLATPLRTLPNRLLTHLQSSARTSSLGFGFLTLDQARRVVCLHETESAVEQVPLVGVWVDIAGGCDGRRVPVAHWDAAEVADNPLVWEAAARFVHSSRIVERVWVTHRTCLVMVVHNTASLESGDPDVPKVSARACCSFFEAVYDDSVGDGILVAPAMEAQNLDVDGPSGDPLRLSVRMQPLADSIAGVGAPENPEEDVPPEGALALVDRPLATRQMNVEQECTVSSAPRQLPAVFSSPVPRSPVQTQGYYNVDDLRVSVSEEPRCAPPTPHSWRLADGPEIVACQHDMSSPGKARPVDDDFLWSSTGSAGSTRKPAWLCPVNLFEETHRLPQAPVVTDLPMSRLSNIPAQHVEKLRQACGSEHTPAPSHANQPQASSDEAACLRQLVSMQQMQLFEMQRQMADLHKLVAGMALPQAAPSGPSVPHVGPVKTSQSIDARPPVEPAVSSKAIGVAVGNSLELSRESLRSTLAASRHRDIGVGVGASLELNRGDLRELQSPVVDDAISASKTSTSAASAAPRKRPVAQGAAASKGDVIFEDAARKSHSTMDIASLRDSIAMSEASQQLGNAVQASSDVPGLRNDTSTLSASLSSKQYREDVGMSREPLEHLQNTTEELRRSGAALSVCSEHCGSLKNHGSSYIDPVLTSSAELICRAEIHPPSTADDSEAALCSDGMQSQTSHSSAQPKSASPIPRSAAGQNEQNLKNSAIKARLSAADSLESTTWMMSVPGAPTPCGAVATPLRDSADTAGGVTPPKPQCGLSSTASVGVQDALTKYTGMATQMCAHLPADGIPRIIWPASSPLSSSVGSDIDADEDWMSDLGDDSSPVLGQELGITFNRSTLR